MLNNEDKLACCVLDNPNGGGCGQLVPESQMVFRLDPDSPWQKSKPESDSLPYWRGECLCPDCYKKLIEGTDVNIKIEPQSKATGPNPKDLIGAQKISLSKFPAIGLLHGAHAMMNGAEKYGPYNWRDRSVQASIYVDAAQRHILSWFEGQEIAEDSGVHHLGHAIACLAILLDAQTTGHLIDDRPICGDPDKLDRLLKQLAETVKQRKAAQK